MALVHWVDLLVRGTMIVVQRIVITMFAKLALAVLPEADRALGTQIVVITTVPTINVVKTAEVVLLTALALLTLIAVQEIARTVLVAYLATKTITAVHQI